MVVELCVGLLLMLVVVGSYFDGIGVLVCVGVVGWVVISVIEVLDV